MPTDLKEVVDTRNKLSEVVRRLTVPIKAIPDSDTHDDIADKGMSRCSLTYAPPLTFVREGTWAKGTWGIPLGPAALDTTPSN